MTTTEQRIRDLGLVLPKPMKVPTHVNIPFTAVNIRGNRAMVSGHAMQDADGNVCGPYGCLGKDVTLAQGCDAAQNIALSVLANLKSQIGTLDRVAGWTRVFGMVSSTPDFDKQHLVINGFSELILEVFGTEIGRHSRSAIGVSSLPMNFALEVECEVELTD